MALPSPADKAAFVRSMFDAIAAHYDLMNRLMTGGRDESWRRLAADAVYPETVHVALDVGAGTGDLSFALARHGRRAHVLAIDFSERMLRRGDAKRRALGLTRRVQPTLGDAMSLPVQPDAADAIVTGFTLRNVDDVATVFREFHRALRPGGRLAVLELTRTTIPGFRRIFELYFHRLVPLLGALVAGRRSAYEYLPESVVRFPSAPALAEMLRAAGFDTVSYHRLALGTVALHIAEKAPEPSPPPPASAGSPAHSGSGHGESPVETGELVPSPRSGSPSPVPGSGSGRVRTTPLTVREVTSRDEWTALLESLPHPHVLQSWEWGDIRRGTGWTPRRLVFERGGRLVAAASVIRRPIPYTGLGFSYCPKGPLLDYADAALLEEVLRALSRDTLRQRSILLKVDPDVLAGDRRAAGAIRAAGYVPAPERLQSDSTVLVDVRGSDDALMKPMSQTWRRYIRKAVREGVTVRAGGYDDLARFYEIHLETARRDQFIPRPLSYYERVFRLLRGAKLTELFLAEVDGQVEAALLAARFGQRAWYLYGASSAAGQKAHAAHLLQWHTMRWARDQGCHSYDMWGAADDLGDADDPLHGVTYFKLGFGGRHVSWIGVYDYAAIAPLYRLWNIGLPRVRQVLRALRGERTDGRGRRDDA